MISALGADRAYISWDTRGRGLSAWDSAPSNYNIDVYASDVLNLIDHLELDRFVLIGTSMGGLISMRLMNLIADRIQGVILNDVGPRLEQKGLDRIASYVGKTSPFASFEDAAKAISDVHGPAFPLYSAADWLAFAKRTMVMTKVGAVFDYDPTIADSLKSTRIDPEAEAIAWDAFEAMTSAPLLVVRGEISDLLSEATAERMIESHPNATLVTAPNIGHTPLLDEPIAVNAINQFLNSLDGEELIT